MLNRGDQILGPVVSRGDTEKYGEGRGVDQSREPILSLVG